MEVGEIVTKTDLSVWKDSVLKETRDIIREELTRVMAEHKTAHQRRWIKTYQVKQMLDLSDSTLQAMRNKGLIPFSIIGGLAFYDYDEIVALMEANRQSHRRNHK